MFEEDSFQARRGAFTRNHVWVTAHHPAELYAAGDYPYQNPNTDGLPAYVEADRPLENTDVVLWYVFGAHHVARPEDWPVMPVAHIGFGLKPTGFFDYNPAIDLPPEESHCSHGADADGQRSADRPSF
jgi:primary-amine oxidase